MYCVKEKKRKEKKLDIVILPSDYSRDLVVHSLKFPI